MQIFLLVGLMLFGVAFALADAAHRIERAIIPNWTALDSGLVAYTFRIGRSPSPKLTNDAG
ncbi:MAG TPA: hypothetical protein DCZ49_07545 [Hyphomonadaceae bacterium]|nr:hypothetical protein [Hyphomonadaceae bacterium]